MDGGDGVSLFSELHPSVVSQILCTLDNRSVAQMEAVVYSQTAAMALGTLAPGSKLRGKARKMSQGQGSRSETQRHTPAYNLAQCLAQPSAPVRQPANAMPQERSVVPASEASTSVLSTFRPCAVQDATPCVLHLQGAAADGSGTGHLHHGACVPSRRRCRASKGHSAHR